MAASPAPPQDQKHHRTRMPSEANRASLDADMIIVNAKVITVDPAFSVARGVAIKDGKIIGVGGEAEVRRYAGPTTNVLDAQGKTVIPGLIDTQAQVDQAGDDGLALRI